MNFYRHHKEKIRNCKWKTFLETHSHHHIHLLVLTIKELC